MSASLAGSVMWEQLGPIVTLAIFGFNLAIAGGAAWIALVVNRAIAAARKDIDVKLEKIGHQVESRFESQAREFGETARALREHLHKIELEHAHAEKEAAQTYVRRDSWHQAMGQLQIRLDAADKASDERALRLEAKMDERMNTMGSKIDRIFERMGGGS